MIKSYLSTEDKDWDKHLGCLAGAYRATVHESTGFTPNMLMFGRENRMPAHLIFAPFPSEHASYGEYVQGLREKIEKAHTIAREHLGRNAKRQKDWYDGKCVLHSYNPGDLVWYSTPSAQIHIAPKLRKSFTGPVIIIDKKNDLNYVIEVNSKGDNKIVHHKKLFPYKGDSRPAWVQKALKRFCKK